MYCCSICMYVRHLVTPFVTMYMIIIHTVHLLFVFVFPVFGFILFFIYLKRVLIYTNYATLIIPYSYSYRNSYWYVFTYYIFEFGLDEINSRNVQFCPQHLQNLDEMSVKRGVILTYSKELTLLVGHSKPLHSILCGEIFSESIGSTT